MKNAIFATILSTLAASAVDSDPKRWRVSGNFIVIMSQAEVDALNDPAWRMENGAVVLMSAAEVAARVPSLDAVKKIKILGIKAKTSALSASFDHGGKTFALTTENMIMWKALADAVADGLVSTPQTVTASDDTELTITDAPSMAAFYSAGVTHVLAQAVAGKALISSVKSAVDKASVDTITDSR